MEEKYHKTKNNLSFKRSIIESLNNDDFYVNEIESIGIFRISKADFYKTFPNVIKTPSWERGEYHYSKFPEVAQKFLIKTQERKYWLAKVSDDDFWEMSIDNNFWCSQQRYGFQTTQAVTNFLQRVKCVTKDDVLLLAYGNKIYSYGIVRPCSIDTNQISTLQMIIENKDYEYKTGLVKFSDSNVFYEDLTNGEESWGQRICVEKWKFYDVNSEITTYGIKDAVVSGIVQESIFEVTKDYGESKNERT